MNGKKLYKSRDNRMISGVCAGIAEYFNMDPTIIRLAWVLFSLLGGSGLLLGAFAGAGVWQTLENGLGIIGAPVGIQRIVIGVIVAGAVLVDVVFRQGTKKAKK